MLRSAAPAGACAALSFDGRRGATTGSCCQACGHMGRLVQGESRGHCFAEQG